MQSNAAGDQYDSTGAQSMALALTGGTTADSITFSGGGLTSGTVIGDNTSTTLGWTGYPYWDEYPWWLQQWPYPYRQRRRTDYIQPFVTQIISGEKVKISVSEANALKRAAKKDPKLARILKKFEGSIEIEVGGLF